MKLQRWWKWPLILLAFAIPTQHLISNAPVGTTTTVLASGFTPASIAQEEFQAQTGALPAPERAAVASSLTPFELTPEQLAYYQARLASAGPVSLQMGPQSAFIAGADPGSESSASISAAGGPGAAAPGDVLTLQSRVIPGGSRSNINEPSVAQEGGYVFYTGNWHAARSRCGGNAYGFPQFCDGGDFVFVDPYADMGDFCCDQEVIADNRRQVMMWYRQGIYNHPSGPANSNRFRLGVSYDAFGPEFGGCFYNVQPTNLNAGFTSQWFDYPHLATTNDHLWIVTNMFTGGGAFTRQVWIKIPLDQLAACASLTFPWLDATSLSNGWGEPVQGATTQMYFGSHAGTNNSFNVSWWNDDSNTVYNVNRAIPAFTFQSRNSVCSARPGGSPDWTNRGDSRIQAGWVRQLAINTGAAGTLPVPANETVGEVGFMWNANQGGSFPQPYVEAATFRQDTLAVSGRPLLWNATDCFQFPFVSPNDSGDLGLVVNHSNAGQHVGVAVAFEDDFTPTPPGWTYFNLRSGNSPPPSNAWGDYNRIRPNYPGGDFWVSSGHTMQGGAVESRYFVVGRERDQNSYWKYIWSTW